MKKVLWFPWDDTKLYVCALTRHVVIIIIVVSVVDGDDLSLYDNVNVKEDQEDDDANTLNELEYELASQDGRLTGNICCKCNGHI